MPDPAVERRYSSQSSHLSRSDRTASSTMDAPVPGVPIDSHADEAEYQLITASLELEKLDENL